MRLTQDVLRNRRRFRCCARDTTKDSNRKFTAPKGVFFFIYAYFLRVLNLQTFHGAEYFVKRVKLKNNAKRLTATYVYDEFTGSAFGSYSFARVWPRGREQVTLERRKKKEKKEEQQ